MIDIVPTILEAAGIPAPQSVNGITQAPLEGVSMLGSLRSADAPETHDVQCLRSWAIAESTSRAGRRSPSTARRGRWRRHPFDEDVWSYMDPAIGRNHAICPKSSPSSSPTCSGCGLIEATKYRVVPLDDRTVERIIPELSGRPSLIKGTSQLMFSGMRLAEAAVISVKNRSPRG